MKVNSLLKTYKQYILKILNKMKLQNKIFIVAIIPAIVSLILLGIFSFNSSAYLMKNEALLTNNRMMADLNEKVYKYIRDIEMKTVNIYNYTSEINEILQISYYNKPISPQINTFAQSIFSQNFSYSDKILGIYIYSNSSKLISSYNPLRNYTSDAFSIVDNSSRLEEFIIKSEDRTFFDYFYYSNLSTNITRVAFKLYGFYNNKYLGTIVLDIDNSMLENIIDRYRIYKDQIIWLQNSNGEIISYSSQDKYSNNLKKHIDEYYKNSYSIKNESPIEKYELELFTVFPIKSIYQNLNRTTGTILFITIFLCISILILSYFLSLTVTKPLKKLISAMEKVEKGDMKTRIKMKYNDEIGILGNSFDSMVEKLDDLITKEYRSNLLKNQAQLKALQAQVNPHFLYNTLQVMSSIAKNDGSKNTSNICIALSDMLRYSVNKDNLSTVYDEINHIKNYLYIQDIRFPNNFRVMISCDSKLNKIKIPRLILQPIIENSIEHGFLNKQGKKLIKVKIILKEQYLYIYVIDNGEGLEEKNLYELNRNLKEHLSPLEKGGTIGIYNVNERLYIMFNEKSSLKVYSKKWKGTIVKIKINTNCGDLGQL